MKTTWQNLRSRFNLAIKRAYHRHRLHGLYSKLSNLDHQLQCYDAGMYLGGRELIDMLVERIETRKEIKIYERLGIS